MTLGQWLPTTFVRLSAALHVCGVMGVAMMPPSWPYVVSALLANHLAIGMASVLPRSRLLGPNMTRLPADNAAQGEVALTFDDGPDPRATPAVLDILDERDAKASFFCVGRRAIAHPALVAEIVRRGHQVENHSFQHSNRFSFFGPWAMGRDVDSAQDTLTRCSGVAPVFFRAPAGIRNPWLHGVLASRGLRLASWTRRGFDTVSRSPGAVSERLVNGLAAGDVLLLHDTSRSRDRNGRPVVLEVLPRVLDSIDEHRLTAVALPRAGKQAGEGRE